jgi:hypothetical protein
MRRVSHSEGSTVVEEELLAPSASTNVIDLTADENNRPVHPVTDTSSVKRQRHAMCKNCKEEFDVTENAEDSCEYHKGLLLRSLSQILLFLLCKQMRMLRQIGKKVLLITKTPCRNTRNLLG